MVQAGEDGAACHVNHERLSLHGFEFGPQLEM